MTSPTLADLLKQTEKWLLQEFVDDQKLAEALVKGDAASAQRFSEVARKDDYSLMRVHAVLLNEVINWRVKNKKAFELAFMGSSNDGEEILKRFDFVNKHLKNADMLFDEMHAILQQFPSLPAQEASKVIEDALAILNRWREAARALAREINALETFEEQLEKKLKLADVSKYQKMLSEFVVDRSRDIGGGNAAWVWRARHIATGKDYALKFYKDTVSIDTDANQNFLVEAIQSITKAAHLEHKNLLPPEGFILNKMEDGKTQVIGVMPLAKGTNLAEYLKQKTYEEEDILRFYSIVGPAVQFMLGKNVVHCDLAPRNIMVVGSDGNEDYILIDFENVVLQSKGASRTIQSVGDELYMPPEVYQWRISSKLFEPNPTIPFFSLGKIGIRMAVANDGIFEELHNDAHNLQGQYTFGVEVKKLLTAQMDRTFSEPFIDTVCQATVPEIKDRFPTWKLFAQALKGGVAKDSAFKRYWNATWELLRSDVSAPLKRFQARARGDTIIPKAPEFEVATNEERLEREKKKREEKEAAEAEKRRIAEAKEAKKREKLALKAGLPENPWLPALDKFDLTLIDSKRFDAAVLHHKPRRLLYPQEQFAIIARGLHQKDATYSKVAENLRNNYEWTNLAIRRVQGGLELWYNPALTWTGNEYVPIEEVTPKVILVRGAFPAGSNSLADIEGKSSVLASLWNGGPGVYDIAKSNGARLWLPNSDDGRWWPVGRGYDDVNFILDAYDYDVSWASRGCVLAEKNFSGTTGLPINPEREPVTIEVPGGEVIDVEPKKHDEWVTFDQSLNRMRNEGYERHLRPNEVFAILCDAKEGTRAYAVRADMVSGKGEWVGVAWKREGDKLLVWEDPVLAWNSASNRYDGMPSTGTVIKQFSIEGIESRTWVELSRFDNALVVYHYGREAPKVPNKAKLWLPAEGSWWPVGRGDGDDSFVLGAGDYGGDGSYWASRGCLGRKKSSSGN